MTHQPTMVEHENDLVAIRQAALDYTCRAGMKETRNGCDDA